MPKHTKYTKNNKANAKATNHQQHGPEGNISTQLNSRKRLQPTSGGINGSLSCHAISSKYISTSRTINIVHIVIQWLESRKKSVPPALTRQDPPTNMDEILKLLPDLRERERRAFVRRVEKVLKNGGADNTKQQPELDGSDNEYSESNDNVQKNQNQSDEWPSSVEFSNNYRWDSSVPREIKETYCPADGARNRACHFSRKVYFKRITDSNHPAYGEYGLYCALKNGAPPGTWLLDYVGHITLGEDQDKQSDYVSDFGEKSELACDANTYGNEARFLNDFRNTGRHPNVEFNFRRDEQGELRQGVYVKLKKDSKVSSFEGVKQHEALLVSYGKGYWRSRHGNLTDFVWRLPCQVVPRNEDAASKAK